MGLINRLKTWVAGEALDAADLNSEYDNILNLVNGNIETANLADDAVTKAKIEDNSVDAARLDFSSDTSDLITHAETTHKRSWWVAYAMITDGEAAGSQLAVTGDYAYPANNDGSSDYGHFHVDIPNGAKLKKFKIIGSTDAANSGTGIIGAQLTRKDHSNASLTLGAVEVDSGGTSDEDTLNVTVNHDTYAYYVLAYASVTSGGVANQDAKIYKIYIEYTTTNLNQL